MIGKQLATMIGVGNLTPNQKERAMIETQSVSCDRCEKQLYNPLSGLDNPANLPETVYGVKGYYCMDCAERSARRDTASRAD